MAVLYMFQVLQFFLGGGEGAAEVEEVDRMRGDDENIPAK